MPTSPWSVWLGGVSQFLDSLGLHPCDPSARKSYEIFQSILLQAFPPLPTSLVDLVEFVKAEMQRGIVKRFYIVSEMLGTEEVSRLRFIGHASARTGWHIILFGPGLCQIVHTDQATTSAVAHLRCICRSSKSCITPWAFPFSSTRLLQVPSEETERPAAPTALHQQ